MNSTSSQGLGSAPTTFPLAKFSYATTSGDVKPVPWRHVSDRGHLFAVFSQLDSASQSLFKVLSGPQVMEEIDLRALGRQMAAGAEEKQAGPRTVVQATIIIQEPCVAVRFPLAYGQIRRFQMKFYSSPHFYEALSLFSKSNCFFCQPGQVPPPRPVTAPSSIPDPSRHPVAPAPIEAGPLFQGQSVSGLFEARQPSAPLGWTGNVRAEAVAGVSRPVTAPCSWRGEGMPRDPFKRPASPRQLRVEGGIDGKFSRQPFKRPALPPPQLGEGDGSVKGMTPPREPLKRPTSPLDPKNGKIDKVLVASSQGKVEKRVKAAKTVGKGSRAKAVRSKGKSVQPKVIAIAKVPNPTVDKAVPKPLGDRQERLAARNLKREQSISYQKSLFRCAKQEPLADSEILSIDAADSRVKLRAESSRLGETKGTRPDENGPNKENEGHQQNGDLDPARALKDSDLEVEADLPGPDKHTMENWMCEQLDNPDFRRMVVVMDGMWQSLLFH